ncbi:MAG: hypothetical protein Q8N84_01220 [bacterium]|nr:hypothetical protein [bacterium]
MQNAQGVPVVGLQFRPQHERKWTPLPMSFYEIAYVRVGYRVFSVMMHGGDLIVWTNVGGEKVSVQKRVPGVRGVHVEIARTRFYLRLAPPPGWPAACVRSCRQKVERALTQRHT